MDDALFSTSAPLSDVAGRVVLEITERASLDGLDESGTGRLSCRPSRLPDAVDDLGAGYAGLTCFAQLEPKW